jgi:phosphate starvation-inducible membrane PsiE
MKLKLFNKAEKVGNTLLDFFHLIGLFIIGATIIWSATFEYLNIMQKPYASLSDILLLFIYLELGAMTGIFFKTHKLPVVFLLFIAITAITRYLAIDIKSMDTYIIMTLVGSILVLTISVWIFKKAEE